MHIYRTRSANGIYFKECVGFGSLDWNSTAARELLGAKGKKQAVCKSWQLGIIIKREGLSPVIY